MIRDDNSNMIRQSLEDETPSSLLKLHEKYSMVVTLDKMLQMEDERVPEILAPIKNMVTELTHDLSAPFVGINLYLSKPDANVLPPHTDRYDVFVLQLWGKKTWNTCIPLEPSFRSEADRAELHEVRQDREDGCTRYDKTELLSDSSMGCNEFEMNSGDTLYMPKGTCGVRAMSSSDEFEREARESQLYHSLMEYHSNAHSNIFVRTQVRLILKSTHQT